MPLRTDLLVVLLLGICWTCAVDMAVAGVQAGTAGPIAGFQGATGGYTVTFVPGDPWISIRRSGVTPKEQALRWLPGGGSAALPLLDGSHLRSVTCTKGSADETITITGTVDWADYRIGITLPRDSPGLMHLWLDLMVTRTLGPGQKLSADARPELLFADEKGKKGILPAEILSIRPLCKPFDPCNLRFWRPEKFS